ncbi:MAG: hypothetical protein IJF46_08265 [Bacteroidaceae bacterium]|nr:hypothetical protein [Bacteroidaceae bacterium]
MNKTKKSACSNSRAKVQAQLVPRGVRKASIVNNPPKDNARIANTPPFLTDKC